MAEKLSTSPYKGSRDFYPEEMALRKWMFSKVRGVLESFAFQEYDGPLLEPFELYAAKTGDEIVNQQLYSFTDRGDRKMAIRPEMTPTLARMVAAKVQELPKPIRWYSIPNLWRYERPQRGRLREHWQINVDLLGGNVEQSNAEVLAIAGAIFKSFGGEQFVEIRFNNRRLMDAFFAHLELGAEGSYALGKLIDAKAKMNPEAFAVELQKILEANSKQASDVPAKTLIFQSFLASDLAGLSKIAGLKDSAEFIKATQELLDFEKQLSNRKLPVKTKFDPSIMRGLDYYTGIVFEAYDLSPENNRALFGGGRYDNLIGLFSKSELSGIGFGLGDVTLMHFLETHKLLPVNQDSQLIYIGCADEALIPHSFDLESQLRGQQRAVVSGQGFDSLKSHLKAASRVQARYFIGLLGDEWARGKVILKDLKTGQQSELSVKDELAKFLAAT